MMMFAGSSPSQWNNLPILILKSVRSHLISVCTPVFQIYKMATNCNGFEWKMREVELQWIRMFALTSKKFWVILDALHPGGPSDINKWGDSVWGPSQTHSLPWGLVPQNLVHFFPIPKNQLNSQNYPELIWALLSVPAIYSYCPLTRGLFLGHTLPESRIIYRHNGPFSREVFHFNKNVYHHI